MLKLKEVGMKVSKSVKTKSIHATGWHATITIHKIQDEERRVAHVIIVACSYCIPLFVSLQE